MSADDDIWTAREPDEFRRPAGRTRRFLVPLIVFLTGLLVGGAAVFAIDRDDATSADAITGPEPRPGSTTTETSEPVPSTTTEPVITTEPIPVTTLPAEPQGSIAEDLERARSLGPLTFPSDCGLPILTPESLPNADRGYRSGTHQGIDFICGERGRQAVAALGGRVVVANGSYVDPHIDERDEILATAADLGYTPPWTLAMLFGRFVVLDHGIRPGVGHVVTIHAHLEEIDPAVVPGAWIEPGQRIGEIGNLGTSHSATGNDHPPSLHLHWELHIGDHFLGEGGTAAETEMIYRALFDL